MRSTTMILAAVAVLTNGAAGLRAEVGAAPSAIYLVTRANTAESRALLSARLLALNASNLRWLDGGNVLRAEAPAESVGRLAADPDVVLVVGEHEVGGVNVFAASGSSTIQAPQAACALNGTLQQPGGAFTGQFPSTLGAGSTLARMLGSVFSGMMTGGSAGLVTPEGLPGFGGQPGIGAQTPAFLPATPATFSGGAFSSPFPVGGFGGVGGIMGGSGGLIDSLAGGLVTRLFSRPPGCKISVKQAESVIAADGADAVIHVKASGACSWQAQASVPWITITSGSGSSGSGIVSYTVGRGPKDRSGSIAITAAAAGAPVRGNATIVVRQEAPSAVARASN